MIPAPVNHLEMADEHVALSRGEAHPQQGLPPDCQATGAENMKRTIILLIFYIAFASCVSLSEQGEKVFITSNPQRIEACKFMGQVVSSSSWGVIGGTDEAYENATNELRNKAGEMGANVVLTNDITNKLGRLTMNAEAYTCK